MGYFPALYKKVTETIRDKIDEQYFDNNSRMEKLDVVFANRYLQAHENYQNDLPCGKSWQLAFEATSNKKLIVLQHLFLGMNAHINLDLGIAAAQIAPGDEIESLKGDFMKINVVLASLVNEVQQELGRIWPMLKFLDKVGGRLDEGLADFSMAIARDGAWRVASEAAELQADQLVRYVEKVDGAAFRFGSKVHSPGWLLSALVWAIRKMERGDVPTKIEILNGVVN